MKKRLILLTSLLALSLVACNKGGSSETPTDPDTPADPDTPDTPTDPDEPIVTEYAIRITTGNGVTITADKEKAAAGDTVTLTVTLSEGFSIVSILANSTECTKVSDTTYTFVMPNRSVSVTCTLAVEGEITIQGDFAAAFSEESEGLYVARNVSVTTGGNFSVYVGSTRLTVESIDRTKCECDFNLAGLYDNYTGNLPVNTVYDFYYDVNNDNGNRPLYIKRVGLTSLPSTVSEVYALFDGRVQSSPSTFYDNLTGATYKNSEDDIGYSYKVSSDGTKSLATYKLLSTGAESGVIYKEKDAANNILKWVDTTSSYDGRIGKSGKALISDYIIRADGVSNEVSDDDDFDEDRQYVHSNAVDFEVAKNFEYIPYELEFEFMDAYRVGMDVADYVKSASVAIESSAIVGSTNFETSIVSSRTYDSSTATDSTVTSLQVHYEYRVDFVFTKEGKVVSLDYKQYTFDSDLYNFTTDTFISGEADDNLAKGTLAKTVVATYEYDEENTISFDATPYFITSIDTLEITSGDTTNTIKSGDKIELESSYINMTYSPSTALDSWQYGVVASSNEDVVYYEDSYRTFMGKNPGTTTLTVSNYSDKAVSKTVDVSINQSLLRNIYMLINDYNGGNTVDYDDMTADTVKIKAGIVNTIGIEFKESTQNKVVSAPSDLSFSFNKDVGLKVSVDSKSSAKNILVLDATGVSISETTTVKMTINTSAYDPDWVSSPIVFTITILPNSISSEDDIIGKWTDSSSNILNVVDKTYEYTTTSGTVNLFNANIATAGGETFKAVFGFDVSTSTFSYCHILNSSNAFDDTYTLNMTCDGTRIGVYLYSSSYEGLDSTTTTDIIGESDGNEDYSTITYSYFTKA